MSGLTPEERDEVRTIIDSVIHGSEDRPHFCQCWPVVRRMLVLLQYHLSTPLQDDLQKVIDMGDMICPG